MAIDIQRNMVIARQNDILEKQNEILEKQNLIFKDAFVISEKYPSAIEMIAMQLGATAAGSGTTVIDAIESLKES